MDRIDQAVKLIRESKHVVVLTGAGISTESGIPDFRSAGTGLWEKIDPMEALSTEVLFNDPQQFYRVGFKILTSMADAQPNQAHRILAEMETEGFISLLVTQNIDNLHQKAGSKEVLEVHGHTRSGVCLSCYKEMALKGMEEQVERGIIPPRCSGCGGMVRPQVVLFGDSLPECFHRAWEEVEKADLLMVIGSSLEVGPVNYLAQICKRLMLINLGKTSYDYRADLIINDLAGRTLKQIYEKLYGLGERKNGSI